MKDNISYGDEITDGIETGYVFAIGKHTYSILCKGLGATYTLDKKFAKKTGKRSKEIANYQKKGR